MEKDRNFSISGKPAGFGLDLDTQPCKNRLLIQVGLMREDNHLTWGAVVEWLQKILPDHQSAFFQGLIEMGIATALSLESAAQHVFLDSEVNFNFVGPMCDIIGVERMALLDMTDISERAQSIGVTNGLILELCDFAAREKQDPTVLVTWLQNFYPHFCKMGDIQKGYKVLRPRIKQLKQNYRNYKTRSYRRNTAMETLLQSPFELVRQREDSKKRVKKEKLKIKEEGEIFPVNPNNDISFVDLNSNEGNIRVKVEVLPLRSDGKLTVNRTTTTKTTRDQERLSLTLLDTFMFYLQKVYCGTTDFYKLDLFQVKYCFMCQEHPDLGEFEKKITSHVKDVPLAPPLEFLHHNAHFLVNVHDTIEQELMRVERELIASGGRKLGRDQNPKFERFVAFEESATSRYIHMACDVLSPKRYSRNSYRSHWLAFCVEKNNPSKLNYNLSQRLDSQGYFEAAAGLVHHHGETIHFFSDLLLLDEEECPNIVLESVSGDASDGVIQSLVCVLAVVYCKILGPYYQLLRSAGEYGLFCRYILCLYEKLLEWSKTPALALEPEAEVNVFLQEPEQERTFNRVFQYSGHWHTNSDLIMGCLKRILKVIITSLDRHLSDFIPGGKYSEAPAEITGCTFSGLMKKYPLSNPYPETQKMNCVPQLQLSESSSEESGSSDSSGVEDDDTSVASRSSPRAKKACVPVKPGKADERPPLNMNRKYVMATVSRNGGPCKTQQDVDKLLLRFDSKSGAEKVEALRCEILYQKMVLDNNDPHLEFSFDGPIYVSNASSKLKLSLPRVKPGYSFILTK
ncbi:hypothetical protein NHX12_023220 [Muraenolepis orangiensis]|uniref:Uncharacterized protein n=1 Tax=Muraenolepis orangiensis TaxID=630683 RepID=A0A9Q0EJZ4_9TELE|nr:hypothetical protein NHX12_023220 [Muraenolepis orangiensis]